MKMTVTVTSSTPLRSLQCGSIFKSATAINCSTNDVFIKTDEEHPDPNGDAARVQCVVLTTGRSVFFKDTAEVIEVKKAELSITI